jgi:hypothetical protein
VPRATRIKADALEELRQEVRRIATLGPDYLERYVDALVEGRISPGPNGLHPFSAKLIREFVLDAEVAQR